MRTPDNKLNVTIGGESFVARLTPDAAPLSCQYLRQLLPYRGKAIHARWSGEALWSPLDTTSMANEILPAENATGDPAPGVFLLYAGRDSEAEILMPYGVTRFATRIGPLCGNPVIRLDSGLERLIGLGRKALWTGALDLCIE